MKATYIDESKPAEEEEVYPKLQFIPRLQAPPLWHGDLS